MNHCLEQLEKILLDADCALTVVDGKRIFHRAEDGVWFTFSVNPQEITLLFSEPKPIRTDELCDVYPVVEGGYDDATLARFALEHRLWGGEASFCGLATKIGLQPVKIGEHYWSFQREDESIEIAYDAASFHITLFQGAKMTEESGPIAQGANAICAWKKKWSMRGKPMEEMRYRVTDINAFEFHDAMLYLEKSRKEGTVALFAQELTVRYEVLGAEFKQDMLIADAMLHFSGMRVLHKKRNIHTTVHPLNKTLSQKIIPGLDGAEAEADFYRNLKSSGTLVFSLTVIESGAKTRIRLDCSGGIYEIEFDAFSCGWEG